MRQKIFLLFVLLCAVVQGAWADDGWSSASSYDKDSDADKPTHYDTYGGRSDVHVIKTAANYLYVMDKPAYYCNKNIYLDINVDVSSKTWINLDYILGVHRYLESWGSGYKGTFYGNGHTIRINLDYESYSSYKGLFGIIDEGGKVQDLNVEGTIYLKKMDDGNGTDLVGGICGENKGTIENCSVSASVSSEENYLGGITGRNTGTGTISNCRVSGNVSSDSRLVGGIAGENNSTVEYCCMTGNVSNDDADVGGIAGDNHDGTIKHCTFYGTRSSDHSQNNLYAGDSGTEDNCYDSYNSSEYNAASGNDLYRYAIKYPYAINVTTVGQGSVTVSAGGEDNIPGARQHQEVTLTTTTGSTAEVTVTDADGNNLTLFGNSGASGYTFIMPQKNVNVHAIFTVPDWPRQGSGTTDSPYLITSADDWNEFALSVNAGINHSGKCVKLTNDISIWMMAGASETNSFQGTFDGDGHTLTFNCNNTTSAVTAPFRYTKNAIIKNLRTAGSITTEAMNAAGIVGKVTGSLSLTNCCSAVTISSSRSDADFHGGLVASNNGSVTISGCVFDGSFVATVAHTNQYGTTYCGGLVGMSNVNTSTTITNSLVAPTSVSEGMVSNTFVGMVDEGCTVNITNSYFVATTNLPGNEGTQAVAAATATANLGDLVQDYGMVKAYQNGIFYDGTYYMVPATLSGSGTELAPYTISSLYEWNSFAYHVNNGTTYSGQYVKLTEDISVETMAGVWSDTQSERRVFSGTFDGDGHTLTINVSNQGRFAAPFKCVSDATIRNLRTAGTIDGTGNSDGKLLAGIVGVSFGNTTISGCVSSVTLTTAFGTDAALAGLVAGTKGGSLTIDGCVFDGSMTGASNTRCAGIAGFEYEATTTTITNTLFAPATLTVSTTDDTYTKTFTRDGDATITNCYYTKVLGAAQGTQAIVAITAPTDLSNLVEDYGMVKAYAHGILVGGTYYGVSAGNVSLADDDDNSTKISNVNGYVATVTLAGRTLYKDGAWNTLCLPFNVDNFTGTPLEGATVKTLASTDFSGGTLTMNFSDDVTSIEAGKPYIVKWANGTDIVDPVFNGVIISNVTANAETNYADFVGTYSPDSIYTDEKTNLYLGADNMLYYPTDENFKVNAFRGYFQLKGLTAGVPTNSNQASISAFKLNFGDGEPTAINEIENGNPSNGKSAWYSLDGRRLSGKPSCAGIYINNGKKVAIK